jgi:8-oxo-dGTP diphosphatase
MTKVSKFRVAVYGLLARDGRVLMTETRVPSGTIMNFPGGGLELGEAPVSAVGREFNEETGLVVEVGRILFVSRNFHQNSEYPSEHLIHLYFEVKHIAGELRMIGNNDDVVALRWVSLDELSTLRIVPADQEFAQSAIFAAVARGAST